MLLFASYQLNMLRFYLTPCRVYKLWISAYGLITGNVASWNEIRRVMPHCCVCGRTSTKRIVFVTVTGMWNMWDISVLIFQTQAPICQINLYICVIETNKVHYVSPLFGKELDMFRTDLLPIIRSLNTVFTAVGVCHAIYVDCLKLVSRQST